MQTIVDLRPIGRDTQSVRLVDLAEGDRIVSIATLAEPEVVAGEEPIAADGEIAVDGEPEPEEKDTGCPALR
jgi:hypothetical protein